MDIRMGMRKNARLNELLFDNLAHLQELYGKAKIPVAGFTKLAAQNFFYKFDGIKDKLSLAKLEECFIFSLMTIQNEQ